MAEPEMVPDAHAHALTRRAVPTRIPPPDRISLPRWVPAVFFVAAVGLVPWIVILATELPRRAITANYRLVWVGFDIGLLVLFACLGWLAFRRSTWTELVAAGAATLLVVDAWFDVLTAADWSARLLAIVLAVGFELPFAGLCLWLARNAERVRLRSARRLGWRVAELEERQLHRWHRD